MLTGYNGQISLGHGAFYAIGAYTAAILMDQLGVPYWATMPAAGAVCFVLGFLFGLPALRLEGLYLALATFALGVAMPQILKYKASSTGPAACRASSSSSPMPPFGLPLDPPTSGSTSSRWRVAAADVPGRLEPAARPHRPRAGGDPRPADRGGRRWASTPRCYKTLDLRRQRAVHRRRRRARRDRGAVRRARQLHHLPVDHPAGRHRGRRPRSISRRDLRRRSSSSSCPTSPTRSPKAAPWAIYGVVMIAFMYVMPTASRVPCGPALTRRCCARGTLPALTGT